jgi:hypothetical protein
MTQVLLTLQLAHPVVTWLAEEFNLKAEREETWIGCAAIAAHIVPWYRLYKILKGALVARLLPLAQGHRDEIVMNQMLMQMGPKQTKVD